MNHLLFVFLILNTHAFTQVYIDPSSDCTVLCDGTLTNPYNNLWSAFLENTNHSKVEFILLDIKTISHYLNPFESGLNLNLTLEIFNDITIRPLYCSENALKDNLSRRSQCLNQSSQIKIYLKTEDVRIFNRGNLTLENIFLDGTEDIIKYQTLPLSLNSTKCMTSKINCCQSRNGLFSEVYLDVICYSKDSVLNYPSTSHSFLTTDPANYLVQPSLKLINCTLDGLNFMNSKSFLKIGRNSFVTILNFKIINSLFPDGTISYLDDSSFWLREMIFIKNISLHNYNPQNRKIQQKQAGLISIPRDSTIEISSATFMNINLPKNLNLINIDYEHSTLNLSDNIYQNLTISSDSPYSFGINLASFSTLNMQNTIFTGCFLDSNAYFIKISTSSTGYITNLTIISNKFGNPSTNSFFIFQDIGSTVVLDSFNAIENSLNRGYLIFSSDNCNLKWMNSKISQNNFADDGSNNGIIFANYECNIVLEHFEFSQHIISSLFDMVILSEGSNFTCSACHISSLYLSGILDKFLFTTDQFCKIEFYNSSFYDIIINSSASQLNFFHFGYSSSLLFDNVMMENTILSKNNVRFIYLNGQNSLLILNSFHILNLSIELENSANFIINYFPNSKTYINNMLFEDSQVLSSVNSLFLISQSEIKNLVFKNSVFSPGRIILARGNTLLEGIGVINCKSTEITGRISLILASSIEFISRNMTISDCNFYSDNIRFAIFDLQSSVTIDISDFFFTNNTSNGNILLAGQLTGHIYNYVFENNLFASDVFLINQDSNLNFSSGMIKNNFFQDISFIQSNSKSNLTFSNSIFTNNIFQNQVLFYLGSSLYQKLENISFENIECSNALAIIYGKSTKLYARNITMKNISLDLNTGLLKLTSFSYAEISDFTILNISYVGSVGKLPNLINSESSELRIYNLKSSATENVLFGSVSIILLESPKFHHSQDNYEINKIITLFQSTMKLKELEIKDINRRKFTSSVNYFVFYESQAEISNLSLKNILIDQGSIFELFSSSISIRNSSFENISIKLNTDSLFKPNYGEYFILEHCFININSSVISATEINVAIKFTKIYVPSNVNYAIRIEKGYDFTFSDSYLRFFTVKKGQLASFGIYLLEITSNITIQNSHFEGASTTQGAVVISISRYQCRAELKNNRFEKNIAFEKGGGAISILDSGNVNFTFNTNIFRENKAISISGGGGKGGAIYLSSLNRSNIYPSYVFTNCLFENNYADFFGGGIYVYNTPPVIDSTNSFINNSISSNQLMNDVGSHAIKVASVPRNQTIFNKTKSYMPNFKMDVLLYESVGSGLPNLKKDIVLLDLYDQIVKDDSISILEFSNLEHEARSSNLNLRSNEGIFDMSNTIFYYKPGANTTLNITVSGIAKFLNLNIPEQSREKSLILEFRYCELGEIFRPADYTCYSCPYGTTHFDLSVNYVGNCFPCSNHMICLGGSQVYPVEGYYRLNSTSNLFLKCPYKASCRGNNLDNQCNFGYKGNLCAQCIDGWGKTRMRGACFNCTEQYSFYLLLILFLFFTAVLISLTVKWLLKTEKESHFIDAFRKCVILKILINYSQLVSLISVIPIEWPTVMTEDLEIQKTISSATSDALSLDCLFANFSQYYSINRVYAKLLLYNAFPFLCCITSLIFWLATFRVTRRPIFKNKDFTHRISITFFMIFYYLQYAVVNENLVLISCRNLYRDDSPVYFLEKDFDLECWEGRHFSWAFGLALPSTILWMVLFPMFYMFKLKRSRNSVEFMEKYNQYTFLAYGYTKDNYYWEGINILKKYLIILGINFSSYASVDLQLFVALLTFWFFYVFQERRKPFNSNSFNQLEEVGLISCLIVSSSGLYFLLQDNDSEINAILIAIAVCSNLYFLLNWILLFFENSKSILNKLKSKIKCSKSLKKSL